MSRVLEVKVIFDRPVAGSDLIEEVGKIATGYGTTYRSKPSPDGFGFLVGQSGDLEVDHLMVAPATGGYGIVPDQEYEKIVVRSHVWPEKPPESRKDWHRPMIEHALIVFARRFCAGVGIGATITCNGEGVAIYYP